MHWVERIASPLTTDRDTAVIFQPENGTHNPKNQSEFLLKQYLPVSIFFLSKFFCCRYRRRRCCCWCCSEEQEKPKLNHLLVHNWLRLLKGILRCNRWIWLFWERKINEISTEHPLIKSWAAENMMFKEKFSINNWFMAFHQLFRFTLIYHFAVFFWHVLFARFIVKKRLYIEQWTGALNRRCLGRVYWSVHLFIPCYRRKHACNWFNPHKVFWKYLNILMSLTSVRSEYSVHSSVRAASNVVAHEVTIFQLQNYN